MLALGQAMARLQLSTALKSGLCSDQNLLPNIFPHFNRCSLAHGFILVTNDCSRLKSVGYEGITKQEEFLICADEQGGKVCVGDKHCCFIPRIHLILLGAVFPDADGTHRLLT